MDRQFGQVAIIGGGLIGASWAALFLAHGLRVWVQDPDPGAPDFVRGFVVRAWPDLCAIGQGSSAPPLEALQFTDQIAQACAGAEFVQECGPDRIEVKRDILDQIEAALPAGVVISSSTSSLMASDIAARARDPGRVVVGHPFNPPHLIPLVELVPGRETRPEALAQAQAFYAGLHREVITVRKEVRGHVANRLSAALYREAVHLVAEGIATVEDVDRAVSAGPGLRWALMGPHLTYHLGGGAGGFRHYIRHLGPTQVARWAELGNPDLSEETIAKLIAGVDAELAGLDEDQLEQTRDKGLVGLLTLKRKLGLGA